MYTFRIELYFLWMDHAKTGIYNKNGKVIFCRPVFVEFHFCMLDVISINQNPSFPGLFK